MAGHLEVNYPRLGRFYFCFLRFIRVLVMLRGVQSFQIVVILTEHVSDYLDYHLNPLVCQSRSYVKDTNHFLSRIGNIGTIPEGAILCTVDVVGLYPSIPHVEVLEAVREALDRRENQGVATDTLAGLASLELENYYFEFNDRFYKQKLCMAIGTKFAPAYANLFMTGSRRG